MAGSPVEIRSAVVPCCLLQLEHRPSFAGWLSWQRALTIPSIRPVPYTATFWTSCNPANQQIEWVLFELSIQVPTFVPATSDIHSKLIRVSSWNSALGPCWLVWTSILTTATDGCCGAWWHHILAYEIYFSNTLVCLLPQYYCTLNLYSTNTLMHFYHIYSYEYMIYPSEFFSQAARPHYFCLNPNTRKTVSSVVLKTYIRLKLVISCLPLFSHR